MYLYATVVNVKDPTHSGLVQVKIHGKEEGIQTLKWIPIARPPTDPAINMSGKAPIGGPSIGLQVGSKVAVMFMDGSDGQVPIIMHSLPTTDKDDDTAAGSTNYAEKGKDDKDYNDGRLIAADDRTDPTEARVDQQTIHQYANNNAEGAYNNNQMDNIEDWNKNTGGSIGQVPSS